ncbi:DUF2218 domain-containing protein [Agrobacterium rosae]|uniref:2,4-dihydroxyhept-2-ene-1,7-dioic acid aldolase n=1 Tax=Agrobacterium rosae TaxID=1972867 RepID=A0AAE5VRM6_9HYPH|nr:DUF2218 domain-containing protein [Agrobacterium rosae]KAA3511167.1 DUF2218 domain-containing protein [Agrobacterium rosae]KAA3518205.1 DUF2218 domain-containing protein [Agrobacterium rosae]MCM2434202.1 DUF2218 domain-containing protein [Agrobacterium rosae]MDX8329531.1 DUF2218 domain-containing protein [Agrobacterium rosae]MQB49485.1 DUF2218 domain-containing protein [Agrobacterium rosae]
MLEAKSELVTESGGKYLVQLFKHFAHKIEVNYSDSHGECTFDFGTASLDAEPTGLKIAVTAPDEEKLERAKSVVESHLLRFAFRENVDKLDWH